MSPPLPRVAGTAVFLNVSKKTTPLALRANVEHNHVLHERVVILSVRSLDSPRAQESDRVTIDDLGFTDDNIALVTARFGFQEQPNVPLVLRLAVAQGLECDIDTDGPTYFISRSTIRITDSPGMSLAQAAVRRRPQCHRPGRLLRPAARAHDHHGLAGSAVIAATPIRRAGCSSRRSPG